MISDKEKNFISLVVYIYNAERDLENFLRVVDNKLYNNFEKYEIICVNDASTDKSINIITDYASEKIGGNISVINMSYYQGLEAAMNAGVDLAIGDFVYEFDTTYIDYNAELVIDCYRNALNGYDIVSVAPEKNRNNISTIFYLIYNKVSYTKNKLQTETFRILSRRGINRISSINKNIPYRKPIYANCGLPMNCIRYIPNENGAKRELRKNEKRSDAAINSLIIFTDIAYRVSVWLAIIMMLGSACGGIYVAKVYFGNSRPVEGWTTTMMFLALCFCALFALLAVVVKYLSIILKMIFQKQPYLIDSIKKYGK